MADDFFDSTIDELFEELAGIVNGPLPLPPPVPPSFGVSPLLFPPLRAFPPRDFGGLFPRHLAASPAPSFFSASAAFSATNISTTTPTAPHARPGTGSSRLPSCPARSTTRPTATVTATTTPRHAASLARDDILASAPQLPSPRPTASANEASAGLASARGLPALLGGPPTLGSREPNSDDWFLNELATRDFSSPSISGQNRRDTAPESASSAGVAYSNPRTAETGACGSGVKREALAGDDNFPSSPTPAHPSVAMSTTRQRIKRSQGGDGVVETGGLSFPSSSGGTRSQQSTKQDPDSASKKRKRGLADVIKSDGVEFGDDGLKVVDLADTEEVPPSLVKPKIRNEVRLSAFQCVICMDDVTDLTVTHCGHLFCGECLHSSLHVDMSKKICPICRQKIEARPASGKFTQKARGYYPLQLKLTTKKSLGKRAAQP